MQHCDNFDASIEVNNALESKDKNNELECNKKDNIIFKYLHEDSRNI
jgi:hypothetical protein